MEVAVTGEVVLRRVAAALAGEDAGPGGVHILIACAPKSGSTFLSSAISHLPDFVRADLTLGYGSREQELCLIHCAATHDTNYVAQHHVRFSETTGDLMRTFHIFPVVLARNLFDSVVSLRDHLIEKPQPDPIAWVDRGFLSWSEERQLDFVIDFCLPWYANFLATWSSYDGPCLRLLYRDVTRRPVDAIAKITAMAGVLFTTRQIEEAIAAVTGEESRLNVGRVGRGAEVLSGAQIDRIRTRLTPYIGLPAVSELLEIG